MPVSEEGKKGLKSGGEVGDVPADANPSGPTTNPKRLEELRRQHVEREGQNQEERRRQEEQKRQEEEQWRQAQQGQKQ